MVATAASKKSIDIVKKFNSEVFNGRDYDSLPEYQHEDAVQHGPVMGMEIRGNDESLQNMQMFHSAFSDLTATEEFAFSDADGEYVCTRYTYTGTHDGDLDVLGIPATGKWAEVPGITVNRIVDGKIAESWVSVDFLGLFQQIDASPSPDDLAA